MWSCSKLREKKLKKPEKKKAEEIGLLFKIIITSVFSLRWGLMEGDY